MKIGSKIFTWSAVSRELSLLIPANKQTVADNSFVSKNAFKYFTPHSATNELLPHEKKLKDIDLTLLREIARGTSARRLSYRGFISSQLQQGPIDDNSKQALKKALAIKRMLALVCKTTEDMKAVELRRISYSKG